MYFRQYYETIVVDQWQFDCVIHIIASLSTVSHYLQECHIPLILSLE